MQLHYEHAVGSVLLPLAPEEVLVPGEVVLYRQRAHWAAMTEAIAETAGVLLLLTLVVTGTPPALGLVVASAIMMSVLLVTRWFTKRDWGWSDYLIIGIVALIAVEITPEVDTVIVVIAIVFVGRMLLAMVRWAFYEIDSSPIAASSRRVGFSGPASHRSRSQGSRTSRSTAACRASSSTTGSYAWKHRGKTRPLIAFATFVTPTTSMKR